MADLVQFAPLLILLLLFWLLMVRPTRKRQQEFTALQASLAVGQQVMLTSGVYGEIVDLADETAVVRIAPTTDITVARPAIGRVIEPTSD